MGRYIDQVLQPGEQVLYSAKPHWIFFLPAMGLWTAVGGLGLLAYGVAIDSGQMLIFLSAAAMVGIPAVFATLSAWFHRWTTETDVTSLRLVYKTGFINRRTFEMSLDKIESVDLDQTVWGRVFGYGDVTIMGVGEGRQTIRTIAAPLAFRTSITAR
jgi:uncharacterized membrane protein YdbT with pleckstrin-like domain